MGLEALVEREGLVSVAGLSAGGWEWSQIEVYYKPDARRFFWLSEGGCSCTYFGQGHYELGELQDGDRDAAIAALKAFGHYDERPGYDDVNREIGKVRDAVATIQKSSEEREIRA